MTYPLSRVIALIGLLCTVGFVWLWSQRAAPEQAKIPVSTTEHRFDIAELNLTPKNPPPLDEALKRPLFNPDRKAFVPAPPPEPIVTPPPIEVVEVAPPPDPPPPPVPVEPEVVPVEPPVLLTEPALPPKPPPTAPEPVPEPLPTVAPAPEPAVPPPRIEDAGLQLKGISITGREKRALLVSPQDIAGKWLGPGELISSWEVTKIENNQVFLRLGKTVAKLQLYVDKPAN
jgi:hypothetical protein